jgi:hypothetical protein
VPPARSAESGGFFLPRARGTTRRSAAFQASMPQRSRSSRRCPAARLNRHVGGAFSRGYDARRPRG